MKKILLFAAGAGLWLGSAAQITLTQADWMTPGKTYSYLSYWSDSGSGNISDSVSLGAPGAAGTYDFSNIGSFIQDTFDFATLTPASTGWASFHPGATFAGMEEIIEDDSGNTAGYLFGFYTSAASAMYQRGATVILDTAAIFGGTTTGNFDTFHVTASPFDTFVTTSYALGHANTTNSYWALVVPINPAPLTFTHSEATVKSINVDGWGDLITPNGTFEVLRVKNTEYVTRIDTVPFVFGDIERDTDYIYEFWANGVGDAVMRVHGDAAFTYMWGIEFINVFPVGVNNPALVYKFQVYPNPAADYFNLKLDNYEGKTAVIYNAIGQVKDVIPVVSSDMRVDVSGYGRGTYILVVMNSEDVQVAAEKVMVGK